MAKDEVNTKAMWFDRGPDGKPLRMNVEPARLDRGDLLGFASACHIDDAGDYLDITFFDSATKAVIARWVLASATIANTLWPPTVKFYEQILQHAAKHKWRPHPASDKRPVEPIVGVRVDLLLFSRNGMFVEIEGHWIHGWSQFIVGSRKQGDVLSKPTGTIQLHVGLVVTILDAMKKKSEMQGAKSVEDT